MATPPDIPEEDLHLKTCYHEYVDFYGAYGRMDNNHSMLASWVFCKHCLDKKLLKMDMSMMWEDLDEDN